MDEGLDGGFVDMSDIRCCLTRFIARNDSLRLYEPESVNDDLSLDGLNGVNNYGDGSRVEGLE